MSGAGAFTSSEVLPTTGTEAAPRLKGAIRPLRGHGNHAAGDIQTEKVSASRTSEAQMETWGS
jgi:hypothetical protein